MQCIRDSIFSLTSTIIIFSKAHVMLCATRIANNNSEKNFYGKFF